MFECSFLEVTAHYFHNMEFLQNAEIKQSVIRSFPAITVPVTSGIQRQQTHKGPGRFLVVDPSQATLPQLTLSCYYFPKQVFNSSNRISS